MRTFKIPKGMSCEAEKRFYTFSGYNKEAIELIIDLYSKLMEAKDD
jgi:hypothetical protein